MVLQSHSELEITKAVTIGVFFLISMVVAFMLLFNNNKCEMCGGNLLRHISGSIYCIKCNKKII